VQGFGVGGGWGGAVLMAVEHGHSSRRGLNASWVQAGVPAGMLLANGVFQLFTLTGDDAFLAWAWRVPFLLGIVLLGVGLFIRLQVFESPVFARMRDTKGHAGFPILEVLKRHPRNVILAMGARVAENGCFYIFTVFVLTYGTTQLKLSESQMLKAVLLGSAVQFFVIPLWGGLSDVVGRRPVYLFGAAGMMAFAFPFFWMLDTVQTLWINLAIVAALVIQSAMYAPQAAFFSELFGTQVRYTGASIGYQLASPFAGGLAPLICTALIKRSDGEPWPVAWYMIGLSAITLISVYLAAETHRASLDDHDHHA
jgi:MFS family permease